jgi:hypothetical protein
MCGSVLNQLKVLTFLLSQLFESATFPVCLLWNTVLILGRMYVIMKLISKEVCQKILTGDAVNQMVDTWNLSVAPQKEF